MSIGHFLGGLLTGVLGLVGAAQLYDKYSKSQAPCPVNRVKPKIVNKPVHNAYTGQAQIDKNKDGWHEKTDPGKSNRVPEHLGLDTAISSSTSV